MSIDLDLSTYSAYKRQLSSYPDNERVSAKLIMKLKTDKAILKQALKHAQEKCERYYLKGLTANKSHVEDTRKRPKAEKENVGDVLSADQREVERCLKFVLERMELDKDLKVLRAKHFKEGVEQLLAAQDYCSLLLKVLRTFAEVLTKLNSKAVSTEVMFEEDLLSNSKADFDKSRESSLLDISDDRSARINCSELNISIKSKSGTADKSVLKAGLTETKNLLEVLTVQNDRLTKLNQQISESLGMKKPSITEKPANMTTLHFKRMKSMSGCFSDLPSSINLEASFDVKQDSHMLSGLRSKNSIEFDLGKLLDDTAFPDYKNVHDTSNCSNTLKPVQPQHKRKPSNRYMDSKAKIPLVPRRTSVSDFICAGDLVMEDDVC
mmetsp:Transcript_3253/g.6705  ORF Transcript_3253/g.6705 Transcript_3253/m.6705 type:complete len:380 (+) Transcript_3253:60-1199(+)